MKYLPLQSLEHVTSALNFETPDLHITGSCDIYTTKAAGGDKKLYKNIEHSLESQYESLLRFSASLSPPQVNNVAPVLNLSRSSPFGNLSQISSRRIFAYLIATLNASHPDYDISDQLRPSDFRREKSLRSVMNALDTTLQNLRPKVLPSTSNGSSLWSSTTNSAAPSSPGVMWNPKMWRAIDKEMALRECSIYSYAPEDDPYDDEDEPALWSFNYFFFNKTRKRVCYVYLRGISIMSKSPEPRTPTAKRITDDDAKWTSAYEDSGASKRAQYWLGDRFEHQLRKALGDEENEGHDDEEMGEDADEPRLLPANTRRSTISVSDIGSPGSEFSGSVRSDYKGLPRQPSEEVAGIMEF